MPPRVTRFYEESVRVYDAMKKDSKRAKVDGVNASVWEGFTTTLFSKLGVPIPYYGKVLTALKLMGCIRLLKRGARGTPSQWALYKKPNATDFEKVKNEVQTTKRRDDITALEQRVNDLVASFSGLDVKDAFADHESRISKLEGVRKTKKPTAKKPTTKKTTARKKTAAARKAS